MKTKMDLGKEGSRFLGAALVQLARVSAGNLEQQAHYMYLIEQLKGKSQFNLTELHLLKALSEQSITAADNLLSRTPDLEARIRAKAIQTAFTQIKEKLEHGIQQQQQSAAEERLHSDPELLSGQEQVGNPGHGDHVSGVSGHPKPAGTDQPKGD